MAFFVFVSLAILLFCCDIQHEVQNCNHRVTVCAPNHLLHRFNGFQFITSWINLFFSYSISHLFLNNKLRWRKRFTFSSHLLSSYRMSTQTRVNKRRVRITQLTTWRTYGNSSKFWFYIWYGVLVRANDSSSIFDTRARCVQEIQECKKKAKWWKKKSLKKEQVNRICVCVRCSVCGVFTCLTNSAEHIWIPKE